MRKLGVSEVSELAGKSARHIRNLCKEGKLPCQKIKISTGEKYLIYVDTEEFNDLTGVVTTSPVEEVSNTYEGTFSEHEEGTSPTTDNSWQEVITSMTSKIESLAKEAGKTELLTDNLMTSEQNVKFYQDEYFKVRHDLEEAREDITSLEKKNTSLQEKIQKFEKQQEEIAKTFWGKRFLAKHEIK